MWTLGIDPSLTRTGLCITDGTVFSFLAITPKTLKGVKRLRYIYDQMSKWLYTNHLEFDAVAIENYSYGSRGRIAELGEAGGVIRLALSNFTDNPYILPTPSQLKKFMLGKGDLSSEHSKKLMIGKVNDILANAGSDTVLSKTQNDEADAAGLALLAQSYVTRICATRAQVEVLLALNKQKVK